MAAVFISGRTVYREAFITIMSGSREVWHGRIRRFPSGILIKFQCRMADSHAYPFYFHQFVKLRRIIVLIVIISFCKSSVINLDLKVPYARDGRPRFQLFFHFFSVWLVLESGYKSHEVTIAKKK